MRILGLILPLAILATLVAFILVGKPFERLTASAPPVEELVVESVDLEPGMIEVSLRADGSEPVSLAQVQVDGAYRMFMQDPAGPIGRLGTATVTIPYPWVEGEASHVLFLTATGATFEHEIEVLMPTPGLVALNLGILALVGLLLGLAPVGAGMLAFPAMRDAPPQAMQFVMALTLGLLAYLLLDTFHEALEFGAETMGRLRGETLAWVVAALTTIALVAIGRRGGKAPSGIRLAFFIALGIGLHNLGEGLAVGASFAAGAAALATFLVVGFVIHNVTEGIAIAAPLVRARPSLTTFGLLAFLAGAPAIAGVWIGAAAVSPLYMALCFAVGAGAILQVIIELVAMAIRESGPATLTTPAYAGGVATGLAVMYATAILV